MKSIDARGQHRLDGVRDTWLGWRKAPVGHGPREFFYRLALLRKEPSPEAPEVTRPMKAQDRGDFFIEADAAVTK